MTEQAPPAACDIVVVSSEHLTPACVLQQNFHYQACDNAPEHGVSQHLTCGSAGNYTASAWRAIDYIIARAGQYGVKLIYVIADNWQTADSTINVSRPTCSSHQS